MSAQGVFAPERNDCAAGYTLAMTLHRAVYSLLVLLTLLPLARADTPPPTGTQRVPLGDGRTLTVSAPKQYTFHEGVWQVMYCPGTQDIVYASTTTERGMTTQAEWWFNFELEEVSYLCGSQFPAHLTTDRPNDFINQWLGDGQYLLVGWTVWESNSFSAKEYPFPALLCGYVKGGSHSLHRVRFSDDDVPQGYPNGRMLQSPSGKLLALEWMSGTWPEQSTTRTVCIYDPVQGTLRRLPVTGSPVLLGWIDDSRLLLRVTREDKSSLSAQDIVAVIGPRAIAAPVKPALPASVLPGVTLSLSQTARDMPSMGKPSTVATAALYLHVTTGKRELSPLLLGGSFLSHDTGAVLAPDQSAAVWIQNGDVYRSTFAVVPATDADKAAAPAAP